MNEIWKDIYYEDICKYNHNKEEYIKTHKIINKTNKGFTFYYKEDFKECEE